MEQNNSLTKRQWNFSALVAFVVLVGINIVAGAALLTGKITWQDWLAGTGPLNGIALGWVSKIFNSD